MIQIGLYLSRTDHVSGFSVLWLQIYPAQANNAYIFPAVGHAAVITRCTSITDEVFLEAAAALADMATPQQLQEGRLFPPLSNIRDTSRVLTAHLAEFMVRKGLGQVPEDLAGKQQQLNREEWLEVVQQRMFDPARDEAVGVAGNQHSVEQTGHSSSTAAAHKKQKDFVHSKL